MTYLTPHLPFTERHALPPPGTHLLITDTLQSSSKFALYHLLIAAVSNKIRIVLVDFRGEGKESHEAVLKKLGKPIPFSSTNFIYISPSSLPSSIPIHSSDTQPRLFDDADKPTLKETYEIIIRHLQGSLVILDGLGELLNMGFEPVEIGRFVRSLLPEIRKVSILIELPNTLT
ncbi:hypothetical protein M231_04644 [Tremella mesenterica]|uniref:Elongator complex protein 5 n=1 Tax=Tremella mesenterica TaxID=5217 RepID=A0A4Q1BK52_TREME|nr:hypothetical protein M231_04644 [Tremella mesenterica]